MIGSLAAAGAQGFLGLSGGALTLFKVFAPLALALVSYQLLGRRLLERARSEEVSNQARIMVCGVLYLAFLVPTLWWTRPEPGAQRLADFHKGCHLGCEQRKASSEVKTHEGSCAALCACMQELYERAPGFPGWAASSEFHDVHQANQLAAMEKDPGPMNACLREKLAP